MIKANESGIKINVLLHWLTFYHSPSVEDHVPQLEVSVYYVLLQGGGREGGMGGRGGEGEGGKGRGGEGHTTHTVTMH